MDNNDRTVSEVVMALQKGSMFMDPFFKLALAGTAYLVTYLARMAKEGKIARGDFESTMDFFKTAKGKYTIINLPYDKNFNPWQVREKEVNGKKRYFVQNMNTGEIVKEKNGKEMTWSNEKKAENVMRQYNQKENLFLDNLKKEGIRHVVMPDLNFNDGMIQIAFFNEDKDKFSAWLERYLMSRMQGGEKDPQYLQNLTSGNTSLVSLPVEGQELEKLKADFQELKINYAILPDLNVGDGETQFLVANSDIPNVEFWLKMYNQELINRGEEPVEMKKVTMEDYARTGFMSEEQYTDTASEDLKKANEKYEGREPGEVEQAVRDQEKGIRSISSEAYESYKNDPEYIEISIDHETLVANSKYGNMPEIKENGLFSCRIPGTYEAHELTLALPEERVFELNHGQQYRAFLKKDEKPVIIGPNGAKVPENERRNGQQIRDKYFDPVKQKERAADKKKTAAKRKGVDKDFNNFPRRNYDFNSLEQKLIKANK